MVQAITEQDLMLHLKAVGFNEKSIQEFLHYWKTRKTADQLRLLAQKRAGLLNRVHREEKQIHCLDYLVYQLEQEEKQ